MRSSAPQRVDFATHSPPGGRDTLVISVVFLALITTIRESHASSNGSPRIPSVTNSVSNTTPLAPGGAAAGPSRRALPARPASSPGRGSGSSADPTQAGAGSSGCGGCGDCSGCALTSPLAPLGSLGSLGGGAALLGCAHSVPGSREVSRGERAGRAPLGPSLGPSFGLGPFLGPTFGLGSSLGPSFGLGSSLRPSCGSLLGPTSSVALSASPVTPSTAPRRCRADCRG